MFCSANWPLPSCTSALARRMRAGSLDAVSGRRIDSQLLRDVRAGEFRLLDLTSATHREKRTHPHDRRTPGCPPSPAHSLHLAAAALADARAFVTYDRQQYDAALAMGSFEVFGCR